MRGFCHVPESVPSWYNFLGDEEEEEEGGRGRGGGAGAGAGKQ